MNNLHKAEVFMKLWRYYVENHLAEDDEVICTICGKSTDEIFEHKDLEEYS